MLYLECQIRDTKNLREGEVIVAVTDHTGAQEQLQVERKFLIQRGDRSFLPVWGLTQDHAKKLVEVELPQEAASGTNRIWVQADRVFYQREEVPA
jgi:hypothetical protein